MLNTTNLYFPDGVDCEHQPYPQQQTYQTDEVEERQDGPGLEHGSPGGQPLLFEGRVVGPPGEGLDLFCIHHRGSSSARQHELERIKKQKTGRLCSAFDCCSLFQRYVTSFSLVPLAKRLSQQALQGGGDDCGLLLINHKLPLSVFFSLPWWSGFIIFHAIRKILFLLTHTKAMQPFF